MSKNNNGYYMIKKSVVHFFLTLFPVLYMIFMIIFNVFSGINDFNNRLTKLEVLVYENTKQIKEVKDMLNELIKLELKSGVQFPDSTKRSIKRGD